MRQAVYEKDGILFRCGGIFFARGQVWQRKKVANQKVAGAGPAPATVLIRLPFLDSLHSCYGRDPGVRPIFRLFDQSRANWILLDVIGFIGEFSWAPYAVIKEILLPTNAMMMRQPMFPSSDNRRKRRQIREIQHEMNMIRHQDDEMTEPNLLFVSIRHGFQKQRPQDGMTKLIHAASFSAHRYEIIRLLTKPRRRSMIETFRTELLHRGKLPDDLYARKPKEFHEPEG